jgi:[acyl-carrier-protein] S-malonyltransferase
MKEVLRDIEVRRPAVPLISNVTAQPLDDPQEIKADIIQQLTSPVKWTASIETIVRQGGATFVEVGPGSVLTGLVKRIVPSAEAWSLEDPDGLSKLLALAGSK